MFTIDTKNIGLPKIIIMKIYQLINKQKNWYSVLNATT